jgi:hypothetical protein
MVAASRKHLTERYASGVDLLLWETEKRLIPDLDAIKSVTGAVSSGRAEGLDMGAALVLVQAVRLGLDRLEYELFESAHAMGMRSEAIAAVLDLPGATAADKRQKWLETRRALPYTPAESQPPEALNGSAGATGVRAARRTGQTAGFGVRAAQRADAADPAGSADRARRAEASHGPKAERAAQLTAYDDSGEQLT